MYIISTHHAGKGFLSNNTKTFLTFLSFSVKHDTYSVYHTPTFTTYLLSMSVYTYILYTYYTIG